MDQCRYRASRWSSPNEWGIERVPVDFPLGRIRNEPAAVFATFSEAKEWLIDQTAAWVDGFRYDMAAVRLLRKSDVEMISDVSAGIEREKIRQGEYT